MRAAITILLAGIGLAGSACQKQQPAQDQNIVITNEIPANADIETLPADESVGTPTDQLENGSDNADVADLNASQNSH
jgi:hypothetical protein